MNIKFEAIYYELKRRIEKKEYKYQDLLPSEHTLIKMFSCSRNTVRRAIAMLVEDGYVQTIRGKGVRIIYREKEKTIFSFGEIESFREASLKNNVQYKNLVITFEEIVIDEELSKRTGFNVGDEVYFIQRLHSFEDMPMIINNNYFLKSVTPGLTKEIAEQSIYEYLEGTLGMTITNSIKIFMVDIVNELDKEYIMNHCREYNCVALVKSNTYNKDGVMFEYTESRHRPDYFSFQEVAVRKR